MYLFVYLFLAVRVFLHCGLSLGAPSGGLLSSFGARASYCGGFSCERGLQGARTSVVAALEHRLNRRMASVVSLHGQSSRVRD